MIVRCNYRIMIAIFYISLYNFLGKFKHELFLPSVRKILRHVSTTSGTTLVVRKYFWWNYLQRRNVQKWSSSSSYHHHLTPPIRVTRLGDFWKYSATKFLAKVAQIIGNILGYFEYPHSYVKTAVATFWATLGNIWATFYFNIWSHCNQSIQPFIHSSPTYKCILHFYHNCWKIEIKNTRENLKFFSKQF